ncbi:mediator complex subunit 25 von Willebrand factor type A-domain-containing protein [Paraphysoderma sedebokerense]|nr:mediator complex subunit 25 von Willebrand factor type A-domain-containing protein [Paraphysoderma sedebokerense]
MTMKPFNQTSNSEVQIVFVIDSSATMRDYFNFILENFVEPILSYFSHSGANQPNNQKGISKSPNVTCGLVLFGDYGISPVSTVKRNYFIPYTNFTEHVKNVEFREGGILRNAVAEGLAAALEMFNQRRRDIISMLGEDTNSKDAELIRHCILITNSLPHRTRIKHNVDITYDDMTLKDICAELRKVSVCAIGMRSEALFPIY